MSTEPISADEMAWQIQRAVNHYFAPAAIADAPGENAFEMTTPFTGQRFRVTVAEVPGWSDATDAELSELTSEGAQP